jgi:LemA protein
MGNIALSVVAVIIIMFLAYVFNMLVGRRNSVSNAESSVDAMLKKRFDLIPNLISAVQEYMKHERGTLNQLTELRAKALAGSASVSGRVELDQQVSGMLRNIMATAENYPQLRASENFIQLQGALNEIEEQLSAARRAFNASVTEYNNAVQMFPTNFVAFLMGYKTLAWFVIEDVERKNINVKSIFND